MITVVGAGAFGTGLAIAIAQKGQVNLWARDAAHVGEMQSHRENARRLPGIPLPDPVHVTSDLEMGGTYLLAVPMQKLRQTLTQHQHVFDRHRIVACCKGIELDTGLRATQVISEVLPTATTAILTGPSFAADIAQGLPTALTLACADESTGREMQKALGTSVLRLYRTTDVTGAEIGGALKNVMAIACGAVMGAQLGTSARAALMTRGFAEMIRMAETKGADLATLAGLSGFGDLVLTCTSDQSRNYQFGLSLGRGETFDPSVTVEGAATARAALSEAQKTGLDMPITGAVVALASGKLQVGDVMDMLLSRPLKEE